MAQSLSNLPIGSLIKFGKYSVNGEAAQSIVWKIVAKDHQCIPAYPSNSITLITDKVIDFRALDARHDIHPEEGGCGYNNYGVSNIDQWLNKDSPASEWYASAIDGDRPPTVAYVTGGTPYHNRPGFLNAFSNDEKNAILATTIRTAYSNDLQDNPPSSSNPTYDITRKVFLPSMVEIGLIYNTTEGSKFEWFADGSHPTRALTTSQAMENFAGSTKPWLAYDGLVGYWLRTPKSGSNIYVLRVTAAETNGYNWDYAHNGNMGVRPVINLSASITISDTTDSDGCYTVVWNNAPNAPSVLNVPTIYGGRGNTISWNAAKDPDGDTVRYELECSVNGNAFTRVYNGTSLTYTHTVASGTVTVQYRVRTVDSKGAGSAYTTSQSVSVINNRAPVISGSDSNLGTKVDGVSVSYTVTDADNDAVDVVEKLDGTILRTYKVALASANTCSISGVDWLKVLNGSHTLSITATDSKSASTTRTYTFTKNVTRLSIVSDPMESSSKPQRVVFTVSCGIPLGAIFKVEVCNNGNDGSPTWEDATTFADGSMAYTFTNTQKTANSWAVRIRVTVDRNGATGACYISGIGGNFE